MKKELITCANPKSPVSEMFRTLRTNLQYLNKKHGAQNILITSTVQGEGKSFVAANLAIAFAQAGKSILLVDCDMRRPRQHKIFNVDMYPGLSNFLSGVNFDRNNKEVDVSECTYKTDIENLSVMPAGNIPPNPSELLQSEKLEELIEKVKDMYDAVIFDGAPCLVVTDATIVSRLVDATLLVVAQKKTKIEDLKEVKTRIKRVGGNVVGVVLNRVHISSKRYGEKYYYYTNSTESRARKHEQNKKQDYSYEKEEHVTLKNVIDKQTHAEVKDKNEDNSNTDNDTPSTEKIQSIIDEINSYKKEKEK